MTDKDPKKPVIDPETSPDATLSAEPVERTLSVTTPEASKATGTESVGVADKWITVGKAWNDKEGWMKSTKALSLGKSGCLVQVTTRETDKNGNVRIAEALTFAPLVNVLKRDDGTGYFE